MAIQTTEHILNEATQLHLRLLQAQVTLHDAEPAEQLTEAGALSSDAVLLTALQKKVASVYLGAPDVISNPTQEGLDAISEKLSAASDILDTIQKNQEIALEVFELANETEAVFENAQTGTLSERLVKSLRDRIVDLTSSERINSGNSNALLSLSSRFPTQANPRIPPCPIYQSHGDLIAMQNESFQITEFKTTFNILNQSWKNIPEEDFEVALMFYGKLKAAYQDIEEFRLAENQAEFKTLIADVEKFLLLIIEKQKEREIPAFSGLRIGITPPVCTNASLLEFSGCLQEHTDIKTIQESFSMLSSDDKEKVLIAASDILLRENKIKRALPRTLIGQPFTAWGADILTLQAALLNILSQPTSFQIQATQAAASSDLLELKKALEPARTVGCDLMKLQKNLKTAFGKLSPEEKKLFHQVLSQTLMEKNQCTTTLPDALLKICVSAWPGSCIQKLEAVEKLVHSAVTKPQAPSIAPAVKKLSDTMHERFLAVRGVVKKQESNTYRFQTTTSIGMEMEGIEHPESPILPSIRMLQKTLPFFNTEASFSDLNSGLEILATLDSMGTKVPFKISGSSSNCVADRPCFHLYFIHKNESPEKLVADPLYGTRAMAGVYTTSNEERSRAILRTILELALEGMEDAINFGAESHFKELVEVLKDISPQLCNKDLPPAQRNSFLNPEPPFSMMDRIVAMRESLGQTWKIEK